VHNMVFPAALVPATDDEPRLPFEDDTTRR
jgi:hypothetical protein